MLAATIVAPAQDRRSTPRIDVQRYTIEAEVNPRAQSLSANVQVQFVPLDDVTTASFELNNALNLSRVVDDTGRQISASRSQQDFTVRLNFPNTLPKGKPATLVFTYDGKLTGNEDSPVYGIKFAALHNEGGFLMYPSRWFPVNDYTIDRFAADMKITVPAGYRVVASGLETSDKGGDKTVYNFNYKNESFPGSIAIVQGEPTRVNSNGVATAFFLRQTKDMAQAYGDEIGKIMTFFTATFGLAPQSSLTVVETEEGTPNGYGAPGILFLNPRSIGKQVNVKLLANNISRQWWGGLVSPSSRKPHVDRKWTGSLLGVPLHGAGQRSGVDRGRPARHLRGSVDGRQSAADPGVAP